MTIGVLLVFGCESADPDPDVVDKNAVFLTFSAKEQTLPTSINGRENIIRMEVGHDADITGLTPEFDIPAGYSVYANGKEQISGSSKVNFSEPVSYEIKDSDNNSASWEVSVVPLGCKILVDASHDGGVWWFPQWEGTGFDPDQPHQGQQFAELLRGKGFDVTELGRSEELTEEMFFGHYIVIRFNGFQGYSARELEVYTKLIDRGMNLVFLTDHKRNEPTDELGNHLGLDFRGIAFGTISTFAPHEITSNMLPLPYIAGSVITNASENPDIEILGWLGETEYGDLNSNDVMDSNEPLAPAVMGVLTYPKSRIFFMGDSNGIEGQPHAERWKRYAPMK